MRRVSTGRTVLTGSQRTLRGDPPCPFKEKVSIVRTDTCTRSKSHLEVGIFLSCHSDEYAKCVQSYTYCTRDALWITYSGYSLNAASRRWLIGKKIDAWLANPKWTEYQLYNPLQDTIGIGVYDGVIPGALWAWNLLGDL